MVALKQKQFMPKRIYEIVQLLNEDIEYAEYYKDVYVVKEFLKYAYTPEGKMMLPEGAPPFKRDPAPYTMSPENMNAVLPKLYIYRREDLSSNHRERLFVQMLEGLSGMEADLLIAMKDQTVDQLFPNLTYENFAAKGLLPPRTVESVPETVVKSSVPAKKKAGRPAGSKNKEKKVETNDFQ